MHHNNKVIQDIMTRFNITDDIYFEMMNRAERYENAYWDCIDLPDGFSVTFALKDFKPYDVEVFDEDDNELEHDFSIARYEALAS